MRGVITSTNDESYVLTGGMSVGLSVCHSISLSLCLFLCLSAFLSVSNITEQRINGFSWNFLQYRWQLIQGTFCNIRVMFHLMPLTVFLFCFCVVLLLLLFIWLVWFVLLLLLLFLFCFFGGCCFFLFGFFCCFFVVVFFCFFFFGGGGLLFRKHPCLLPILRKKGWTDFHEISRQTRYAKQFFCCFFFLFFFLGGGGLLFRKHPCLLPILRKKGWTDFHEISRQTRYAKQSGTFLAYCMLPFGSRIDFLFSGSMLDSNIMEKNEQTDFHWIVRICWTQQNKIID